MVEVSEDLTVETFPKISYGSGRRSKIPILLSPNLPLVSPPDRFPWYRVSPDPTRKINKRQELTRG